MRHQAELKRVFERIGPKSFPKERHLMPLSLRIIKELGVAGIDWRGLHVIDVFSLVCSIRIDNARERVRSKRKPRKKLSHQSSRNSMKNRNNSFINLRKKVAIILYKIKLDEQYSPNQL